MPFLILALVLFLPLAFVLLLPFSLVQRYRAGTARRIGRSWVAGFNLVVLGCSALLFVLAAAVTNVWVPDALLSSLAGLAGGLVLGLLGLRSTRWEPTARGLQYTPPRALVLAITLAVTARIFYGFARAWHVWQDRTLRSSWLAETGAAGSLAIGGLVLGYYLTYWAGITRRVKRHGKLNVLSVR